MVKSVLGVNHSGLTQWCLQRLSAMIMVVYTVCLVAFLMGHSPIEYYQWHGFFGCVWIKVSTLIVLVSILYHAWIGMWTILTDYVKPYVLNIILQVAILLSLVACFFYALLTLWSV